jgi:hypothetical protein
MKAPASLSRIFGAGVAALLLAGLFGFNSWQNAAHQDYRNSNFAKFWIAGHMVLTGQNPYNPSEWHAEHIRLGSSWIPDTIFLYPLPQAFFVAPLALLPARDAFILWGVASQAIVAATCFVLLSRNRSPEQKRLFLPLVVILLFFGPVYLSLQIGSLGAFSLGVIVAALLLLDRRMLLVAGVMLTLLLLKPAQGIPLIALVALWQLFRRNVRMIIGALAGGTLLILAGLLYDPRWLQEFLSNSAVVSSRTLGAQPTVWSLAYLACGGTRPCTAIVGCVGFLGLLGLAAWLLWRHRTTLGAWEAFSIAILGSSLASLYLFAYDQIYLLVPIVWICCKLVARTKSYVWVFLWLAFVDLSSLALLWTQARTGVDTWSITTAAVVLGVFLWLLEHDKRGSVPATPSP